MEGSINTALSSNYVVYSSFYVMADMAQLDPVLLGEWINKKKPRLYRSVEMDVWLVDCYFRQIGKASPAAARHAALTEGLAISGGVAVQSRWNAPWDRHHFLLRAGQVHTGDLETIEMLEIPMRLPDDLDEQKKEAILENFLKHAESLAER